MPLKVGDINEKNELISLTKEDMLNYYRDALVAAAGNGAAIADIYTQVLVYQSQHQKLTDTMLSLRTIEELGSGIAIDVGTNQGKARYLQLFQTALSLWLL